MTLSSDEFPEYTLHVVLATVPQRQEEIFYEHVTQGFFDLYREKAKDFFGDKKENYGTHDAQSGVPILYNPLRYYLFGNYDIAYITLIDNFKFAQKLFEPHTNRQKHSPILFSPHTFQSFTGITYDKGTTLADFFQTKLTTDRKYFVGICNLKLSNGILIGNGKEFISSVKKKIREEIAELNIDLSTGKVDILILHSFSWFEISVMLFTDVPDKIGQAMKKFRKLAISDLDDWETLVNNSLYFSLTKSENHLIGQANVFADTHTYFGVHADLIHAKDNDPYLQNFYAKNITLRTEIEWQLKPGHVGLLASVLDKWKASGNGMFILDQCFLLAGKSDYLLKKEGDKANDNIELLRLLTGEAKKEIFDHVRKVKTRVSFKGSVLKEPTRPIVTISDHLQKLGVTILEMEKLDIQLKALKVSRQIRAKVLKIFSNFNNGIQDPILFPFFLDFCVFISEVKKLIQKEHENWQLYLKGEALSESQVMKLERSLMERIQVFQEGFNIRMLNCYQFEDITDFDLDFNSSIQQLLSAYSTMANELGNYFYDSNRYGPLVQLHLNDTVANYISINYYIHHLTSPEFVFATITKEILNFAQIDNPDLHRVFSLYEKHKNELEFEHTLLNNLVDTGLLDVNYLFVDVIRYAISYNFDFSLFHYWFWTYNLQNASLYDKKGMIEEDHFQKELFRIIFIAEFFHDADVELSCPLPELFTFWDRHFVSIKEEAKSFTNFLKRIDVKQGLLSVVFNILDEGNQKCLKGFALPKPSPIGQLPFLKTLRTLNGIKEPQFFFERISLRENIYSNLSENKNDWNVKRDSLLYFQWYMYQYLQNIYEANGKHISLLRRNWDDGTPLQSFISCTQPHLYAVDQTGGLFFDNILEMNKYFKMTTMVICDIWDYSLKRKKLFILDQLGLPS